MNYIIQVNNHPDAGKKPSCQEAVDCWQTWYDGPIPTAELAHAEMRRLAKKYKYVRAFRGAARNGGNIGKLWYEISAMNEEGGLK